jgi:hypothetical protein
MKVSAAEKDEANNINVDSGLRHQPLDILRESRELSTSQCIANPNESTQGLFPPPFLHFLRISFLSLLTVILSAPLPSPTLCGVERKGREGKGTRAIAFLSRRAQVCGGHHAWGF